MVNVISLCFSHNNVIDFLLHDHWVDKDENIIEHFEE